MMPGAGRLLSSLVVLICALLGPGLARAGFRTLEAGLQWKASLFISAGGATAKAAKGPAAPAR